MTSSLPNAEINKRYEFDARNCYHHDARQALDE
jgi:hypothetical protein